MTGGTPLVWTAWPLRNRPARGAFAIAFVIAATALVAAASSGPALPAIAIAVFAVTLAPFYLPTRYILDDEGVSWTRAGRTTRRDWSAFRRVGADEEACFLSPYPRRHPLDGVRGVTLYLDGNRAAVLAHVEEMVGKQGRADAADPGDGDDAGGGG